MCDLTHRALHPCLPHPALECELVFSYDYFERAPESFSSLKSTPACLSPLQVVAQLRVQLFKLETQVAGRLFRLAHTHKGIFCNLDTKYK